MLKVFLLDPAYPESTTPGFLRHAAERAGWDIVRPQFFLPGMDGARWFADFDEGLAEAQILVGLGDFAGLTQWGARLDEALALLGTKIDDGTPLLLSGTSSLAPMHPPGQS